MIIVNCPHCGKEHMVNQDEMDDIVRGGKSVVDCDCGKLYVIEDDFDGENYIYFTH